MRLKRLRRWGLPCRFESRFIQFPTLSVSSEALSLYHLVLHTERKISWKTCYDRILWGARFSTIARDENPKSFINHYWGGTFRSPKFLLSKLKSPRLKLFQLRRKVSYFLVNSPTTIFYLSIVIKKPQRSKNYAIFKALYLHLYFHLQKKIFILYDKLTRKTDYQIPIIYYQRRTFQFSKLHLLQSLLLKWYIHQKRCYILGNSRSKYPLSKVRSSQIANPTSPNKSNRCQIIV